MSCVTTTATANVSTIRDLAKALARIRISNWWILPSKYDLKPDGSESWLAVPPGGGIIFGGLNSDDHDAFTRGYTFGSDTVDSAISEINALQFNLTRSGGSLQFQESTILALGNKAQINKDRLNEIKSSLFFQPRYGGRGIFAGVWESEYYAIAPDELAELNYTAAVIGRAADDLAFIADSLSYGDCNDDGGDDENCDRIAAALEAIAQKEFGCDLDPVIDAVEKLTAAVGVIELDEGIKLPKLITAPPDDNKGKDSDYVTVNSLPEFLVWHFRQLDALMGRFPIKIVQADGDLTAEGEQERTITVPNLSEGIAELIALNAIQLSNSEANLKATVSNLGESVLIKKMLIQCKFILDNVQDFTGINVRDKKLTVPFSVDIRETDLDKLLQPAEIEILVDEHRPKNDGSEFDIERIGKIVNTIYAIVSAVYVHRIDPDDPVGSVGRDLNKIRDGLNLVDSEDEDGYAAFLSRTERGFTDAPFSEDVVNPNPTGPKPYGRDYTRRPLIRRTEGQGTDDIKDGDTTDGGEGGEP